MRRSVQIDNLTHPEFVRMNTNIDSRLEKEERCSLRYVERKFKSFTHAQMQIIIQLG